MKKLLLIDDEIDFLESFQEFLSLEELPFATQIAYSVDQAKKIIKNNNFDLIITDIRMPEESGLELLIFLRKIEYMGEIMVMTAYSDSEISSHIKTLGSTRIIEKPINFEWFKNMLIDFFTEKGFSGTIDSIDLTTLLQVIHLEKKSTGIEIKINRDIGFLYFKDGELINAKYKGFIGEEAALKLIGLNKGHFNLVKNKRSVETLINIPFMHLLIGVMKDVDEIIEKKKNPTKVENKTIIKETILLNFKDIAGFQWVAFFIDEDVLLTDIKNDIDIKPYISFFSSIHDRAEFVFHKEKQGDIEMILIHLQKGILAFSELKKKDIRMIMYLDINGDLVKSKQIIKKIANGIGDFIT